MKVIIYDKKTGDKSPEMELNEFITSDNLIISQWREVFVCYNECYELRPVLEGVEVWIARNADSSLYVFNEKPVMKEGVIDLNWFDLPDHSTILLKYKNFPSVNPGQCVKAKIVLEEE